MSVRDAAIQILREAGGPLHARKIAKGILDKRLWQTTGKTPAATVSARLYADIKQNGDKSPFVLVRPQTFGLRELGAKLSPVVVSHEPSEKPKTKPATTAYSFTKAAEKVLE